MEFKYRKTQNTRSDPKTGRRVSMWTEAKDKKLYRLYVEQKKSMTYCANFFDCCVGAVQNRLYAKEWARRKPRLKARAKFSVEHERDFLLRLYASGVSAADIAKEHRLNLQVLIAFFKTEGVFRDTPKDRVGAGQAKGAHWSIAQRAFNMKLYLSTDLSKLHPLEYNKLVRKVTGFVYKDWLGLLDPEKLRKWNEFELDHIFSLKAGCFKANGELRKSWCPLTLICHPANLRITTKTHNVQRKMDSESFDVDALKARVKRFNKAHGDPFRKYT